MVSQRMASARWLATKSGSTSGSSTGATGSLGRKNALVRISMMAIKKISRTRTTIKIVTGIANPFSEELFHFDVDALVDFTLALVIHHVYLSHLAGIGNMRTAVSLQIQANQFNGANLLNVRRQQVDFSANQVGDGKGFLARQDTHMHSASSLHLTVDGFLDHADQLFAQILEFEIHAAFERFHIAAGDLRAVVAENHAAQDVQRAVGAHQLVARLPVDLAVDASADRWQGAFSIQQVPDALRAFFGARNRVNLSPDGQGTAVSGLTAAARIKRRPVEQHGAVFSVDGGDLRVKLL